MQSVDFHNNYVNRPCLCSEEEGFPGKNFLCRFKQRVGLNRFAEYIQHYSVLT